MCKQILNYIKYLRSSLLSKTLLEVVAHWLTFSSFEACDFSEEFPCTLQTQPSILPWRWNIWRVLRAEQIRVTSHIAGSAGKAGGSRCSDGNCGDEVSNGVVNKDIGVDKDMVT